MDMIILSAVDSQANIRTFVVESAQLNALLPERFRPNRFGTTLVAF